MGASREPSFGPASAADDAGQRRHAASRDRARNAAYHAGASGSKPRAAFDGDDEAQDYWDLGAADGPDAAHASRRAGRRVAGGAGRFASKAAAPVTSRFSGDDLAGAAMGALGYVLVINYLRGGLPQVKGWFAAKFLNRPYQPAKKP